MSSITRTSAAVLTQTELGERRRLRLDNFVAAVNSGKKLMSDKAELSKLHSYVKSSLLYDAMLDYIRTRLESKYVNQLQVRDDNPETDSGIQKLSQKNLEHLNRHVPLHRNINSRDTRITTVPEGGEMPRASVEPRHMGPQQASNIEPALHNNEAEVSCPVRENEGLHLEAPTTIVPKERDVEEMELDNSAPGDMEEQPFIAGGDSLAEFDADDMGSRNEVYNNEVRMANGEAQLGLDENPDNASVHTQSTPTENYRLQSRREKGDNQSSDQTLQVDPVFFEVVAFVAAEMGPEGLQAFIDRAYKGLAKQYLGKRGRKNVFKPVHEKALVEQMKKWWTQYIYQKEITEKRLGTAERNRWERQKL